jgi:hypothetical protein
MPYIEKIIDHISDFGWEIASVEYDIDMISDKEDWEEMIDQERKEIEIIYNNDKRVILL